MKNKKNILKVLLDTSFILPTLGIDVAEEVLKGLQKLAQISAEIYYSRFSILESLWIATRLIKNTTFDIERFTYGLKSIMQSGRYKSVNETPEIFIKALKLYNLGHKDLIDNILYASSTHLNLKLLTLDAELKEFINNKKLEDSVILPDQIKTL